MKKLVYALVLLLASAPAFAGPVVLHPVKAIVFAPYIDDSTSIVDNVETIVAAISINGIPDGASVRLVAYFGFGLASGSPLGIVRVRKGSDLSGRELDRIYLAEGASVITFPVVDFFPSTPRQDYVLTIAGEGDGYVGIGRIRIFPEVLQEVLGHTR